MTTPVITQSPFLTRAQRRTVRKWKFSLHDSEVTSLVPNDLGAINRIRWLRKARGKRLELILDKPGSLSFNVPTGSAEADDIYGYEIVRCVLAHAPDKNGVFQPIWSGPIWTAEADEPTGKLNVTCVGWDEIFEHREFRTDVNYVRATNGEMAASICRTASNQYANDGYGLGASAEDLLYGSGDFENTGSFDASGQTWNFVGLVTMGDIFNRLNTGAYESIAGPDEVPPSGAHWFRTTLKGANVQSYAWISSRQGLTVEGRNVGFAVEPNTAYRVDGIYHVLFASGGAGAFQVRWYDSAGALISTNQLLTVSNAGVGGEFGYSNEDTQIDQSVFSPATAARAAVVIGVQTGSAKPGGSAGGATEFADVLWDNIVFTKANDAGRKPFIIRPNKDDPYIINQVIEPSMEGSVTAWAPSPGTVTRAFSSEWASSGVNSCKVTQLGVITTGEYGVTNSVVNPFSPDTGSVYFRIQINILKAGTNGTYARISTPYETFLSNVIKGTGVGQLEVYVPALGVPFAGSGISMAVVSSALPGEDVIFYIDDATVVLNEPPPIEFYEGSLANSRWYDKNSLGRVQRAMGPVFTRTYTRGTKLSQVLTEMTEIEWGVDYQIDPVTRKLKLFWDSILPGTTLRGRGNDRRDVVFGYGVAPHNVGNVRDARDASKVKNRVNTEGKVGRGLAQDLDEIDRVGIFEETIQMTDVADPPPPSPSILAVYAGSEVAMFSKPFRTITFQPKRYVVGQSTPMFGVDYDLGDLTTLKADKNVTKVGVSGGNQPDTPPKFNKRIDDFRRNGQDAVGVETLEGQGIWVNSDYFGALNMWSITKFGDFAYAENPTVAGALLKNMYGPDWDFAWMIRTPTPNTFVDFCWGSQIAGAALSGGAIAGQDYHRMRYTMAPTGNAANDTVIVNADTAVNAVTSYNASQTTYVYMWFQKRGTKYNLYRQIGTGAQNTADMRWQSKPWTLIHSFELTALDQVSNIGMAQFYASAPTNKYPGIGFLYGGTWQSIHSDFDTSPGQTMRIFGANITFDDNNDGENIDSLTTMLSG